MEQLDTLIFDAIIKLRNNKKQLNDSNIHTLILIDYKSLSKKQLEKRLLTLAKKKKNINRPPGGKSSCFTVSDENTDDVFINNSL